ncbi:thioredoxin fold domain-containing protein [Geomonas agri]|uniref:thioredoxin fold domain-containing protein n=1 Tax=Geomonas agri TaxID=2873702 RepID=UPI001CD2098B|nr:thioredoxin fold domain-containing protein [Geomonas agri]
MIPWETDMGKALARAKAEQKTVLLEFFSPQCIGCKQMEEVTFADEDVVNFIADRVIPVRVPVSSTTQTGDFRISWTPTLITLDLYGREHQRTVGYLPPDEIVGSVLLGMAKASLDNGQYNEAVIQLTTLLNGCPKCAAAPEAVYLRGVARFSSSHDPAALKDIYQQLSKEYPDSDWTKRAQPFTLL